ncbi:hypothetical protein KY313_03185 [Candidatus Woesearchaeota archaeon]|jgi:hypothetical protein|nr:hypothetical protein [Candidatus Woesearchaeota archaeon]
MEFPDKEDLEELLSHEIYQESHKSRRDYMLAVNYASRLNPEYEEKVEQCEIEGRLKAENYWRQKIQFLNEKLVRLDNINKIYELKISRRGISVKA